MALAVSGISIIAYVFFFFWFRREWIVQQVAFLVIYLISLTIVGELDTLLPIYFIFSVLPFLLKIRRISSFTGFLILFYGTYLVYGLIFQDLNASIVTFIAKMWQLLVFFIIIDASFQIKEHNYINVIKICVIIESILGVYLLFTSTRVDALNGLIRLVSNSQPITGNLGTAILPISVYFYMINRGNVKRTRAVLLLNIIFLIWVVLSGTRGYTVEFVAAMVLILFDFFVNSRVGLETQRNRLITGLVLGMFTIVLLVVIPELFEKMSSVLRIRASVGIRKYENAAVLDYFGNAPWINKLFGIGFGGKASNYDSMLSALYKQFGLGMWNKTHYLNDSGALFHSLFANILVTQGLFGISVFIVSSLKIWKRITTNCGNQVLFRRVFHLFQLSLLFMNFFRWSAVCGIGEMIILALVLKKVKQDNEREKFDN